MRLKFTFWPATVAGIATFALFVLTPLAARAQEPTKSDTHGIAVGNMDPSVKPGDDFYEYANGAWIKRTEIPPDRGTYWRLHAPSTT